MLQEMSDFLPQMRSFLEDGIEYIGIINKKGRLENFVCKKDIKLSVEKREMFCMGLQLQNSMQQDYDDEFGAVSYIVIERESSKIILIPTLSDTILAIINKELNHNEIINKIKSMMSSDILVKSRKEISS